MPHDLDRAFNHDIIGTELVLESAVDSLSDRALVITDGIGRLKFLFLTTPRIVVNQRDMVQAAAIIVQLQAAIGGIHHIVKMGDASLADQRQRNGCTAIVHRRRRQQGRDRHTAVGGINVQLAAIPAHLVALGIALRAVVAARRDLGEHLCQALLALTLNGRCFGRRARLAAPGAASPSPRHSGHLHGRLRGRKQDGLGGRNLCCMRGLGRAFARHDGRTVTAEVTHQLVTQIILDQSLMDAFRQSRLGKFFEGTRERGLGGEWHLLNVQLFDANDETGWIDA